MNYKYQKITYAMIIAVIGVSLSSSFITAAWAPNAHFISTPNCTKNPTTFVLTCTGGKVAGLGQTPDRAFISATFTGVYQCEAIQGSPVQGTPAPVDAKGGNTILLTYSINPAGAIQQQVSCLASLVSGVYTNIQVHFTLNGQEVTGSPLTITSGPI